MAKFFIVPSRKIAGSSPSSSGGESGASFTLVATNGVTTGGAPISGNGGVIQLDLGYSPTWTGVHTYTQPIVFAPSQTFDASKLTLASANAGDMLYISPGGSSFSRLPAGSPHASLRMENGQPSWQYETGWTQDQVAASDDVLIPVQRQQQVQGSLVINGVYTIEGKTVIAQ